MSNNKKTKNESSYGCGRFTKKPRRWTAKEEQFVRDNIAEMTHAQIADQLDRTEGSVNGFCTRKKIKSPGHGHFSKGHQPFNKGMKQTDYMSREAIDKTKATWFKKGGTPHNTKWDGAITLRHDQIDCGAPPYLYIRISAGNWQKYQRYLWEKKNGKIPDDRILVSKDGNTLNPQPDNWELISRAEHAERNRDWQKSMRTMDEKGNHPSKDLTDNFVASMVAGHDQEIKEFLLNERPDIISLARANYQLNRRIEDASNKNE